MNGITIFLVFGWLFFACLSGGWIFILNAKLKANKLTRNHLKVLNFLSAINLIWVILILLYHYYS